MSASYSASPHASHIVSLPLVVQLSSSSGRTSICVISPPCCALIPHASDASARTHSAKRQSDTRIIATLEEGRYSVSDDQPNERASDWDNSTVHTKTAS